MSATVYINADEEIPTSATFDDENWREELCDIVISNKAPKTSHSDIFSSPLSVKNNNKSLATLIVSLKHVMDDAVTLSSSVSSSSLF